MGPLLTIQSVEISFTEGEFISAYLTVVTSDGGPKMTGRVNRALSPQEVGAFLAGINPPIGEQTTIRGAYMLASSIFDKLVAFCNQG